jgi:hypothetical protein
MTLFARISGWWHRAALAHPRKAARRLRLQGRAIKDDAAIAARRELRLELQQLSPAQTKRLHDAIKSGADVTDIAHRFGLIPDTVKFLAAHSRQLARRRRARINGTPERSSGAHRQAETADVRSSDRAFAVTNSSK